MFLLLWPIFAAVVAIAAGGRGRNPIGWFLLAVIISPLIAAILLALLPVKEVGEGSFMERWEGRVKPRFCEYCAERIKAKAKICKHCGYAVALAAA